jgi:hypothetical protein
MTTATYFIPQAENEKERWLKNFADKIKRYAEKYQISASDILDIEQSCKFFSYWLHYLEQYSEFTEKLIYYKNQLKQGMRIKQPLPPASDNAPAEVKPQIFKRAAFLGISIKSKKNYLKEDGIDLGIEPA